MPHLSFAFRRHLTLTLVSLAALLGGCAMQVPAPALSGPAITIYAAGDIADCRWRLPSLSGAAATAALLTPLLAADPEARVLALGDLTYPVGLPAEFTDCYAPTWGRFRERTLPVPGNHEYYTPLAPGYYGYFGAAAAPERSGHYAVQLGSWRVIAINSAISGPAAEAQLEWLRAELSEHRSRCTLAFWHHPRFSSGGHGDNARLAPIWTLLAEAGADLALSGHDHDYERLAPQDSAGRRDDAHGLRQFVVGTGGAQLTPFLFTSANSERRDNSTHGVLRLALRDDGYEWEFLGVAGNFQDKGAARCHARSAAK
ncbi:metallophosphoesterase family protein [Noviherbaspirillum pedocola]|uniref:Metallophosphoesterase n=1 Tax=Noviherbaspirillum pedocola TaxID=2801341 RepID=A0A934SV21_9BURK|nr:metallophosphoesterase [Noviherbaspirillum pedocola]MBK4733274.1 metallophosphoesterase [Noviherbaspirillum pedocola]